MTSETTGGTTTEYEYDANGALTKSDDGTTVNAYEYDPDGYLTAFDTTGTENDATYTYDDDKRRIARTVDSTTTKYFLDGSNVIADYDGNNLLLATYITPGLDDNLSQTRDSAVYYYMKDGLGSIRNLVDANEDTQNTYDYYAFGKELGSWSENITNRYTYTAREYDPESEQYYYRARYYDGGGRFNRRDPVWQGNPYLYCGNDPIMRSDATGMYGPDLHRDATTRWAQQLEFSGIPASMIGEADIGVDSLKNKTNWAPVIGDQSYHFNRNPGGIDTRLRHHTNHRAKAKYLCWKECKPREAAKQLGIALHPLQDWVAHGDYAVNDPGGIYRRHNIDSPQRTFGKQNYYPDKIYLDAIGSPDGRPAGAAMIGTGPGAYAWYMVGTKRFSLTRKLTKDSLTNFKTFIEQKGCCECRLFFLGD